MGSRGRVAVVAIESESDLKNFYNVWFEYLIRTEFFHFAVYEDNYVRNNAGFPEKYDFGDGEYRDPYSREMLLFLKKYERWWLDRILDVWTFDDFWADNGNYIEKFFYREQYTGGYNKEKFRFLLPAPGRSWGGTMSDRYKTKLNHYVMNLQYSPGQIFKGQMRRTSWLTSENIVGQNLSKELLCLPFPACGSKKYQKWDISFSTPAISPFECRAKYGSSEFYDQREYLKKDKAFVVRVFKDVESGWFPSSPL